MTGRSVKTVRVANYKTRKLIDAKKAYWVIGGKKPGVMTNNAKWAFGNKADATTFIGKNGGAPADFDEVMKAASAEQAVDAKAPMHDD